ncbi:MAG: hypothetical protein K1X29_03765 [Bdellovibrionales bacterium]|nr:hypothetical protein [Bdellovibrionales bacterium]
MLLAHSPLVHSGEVYEFYNGVRSLGMGGSGIAVVNDETALLVNPAALGKLRDYFITVIDPEIEGSSNAISVAGLDLLEMFSPQKALDKLNTANNREKHLHLKGQVFPSLVVPNFGIGVFGKYSMDGEVDATSTQFEYHYFNDFSLVAGFNFRLWDGIIKLGANARATNRVMIDRTDIPTSSTGLTIDSLASEGFGVGSDAGLILTAPIVWLPTLAAVWRDVGNTSYSLKDGIFTSATTKPPATQQTVDVALAVFPILANTTRATFTLEYRDVLTSSQELDQWRRTHGGIEFNFSDVFFLRAGMNQHYWTAGLEISMFNYQFQMASYGEEIGTASATREDRRYTVKFAYRF